ncbi:MAG: DsbA family protein [Candidatus Saccharimonadaceae bacterium]
MNKTGWIIFSVAVVALLGGLATWTRIANPPIDVSGINNNSVVAASQQNGNIGDHVKGSDSNKILFVEYADYQCPSCAGAYPNMKTIMQEYSDSVTFVFRNFPLTSIHPNAKAAAATAEAAGLQGKYWEMHDILYQKQNDWSALSTSQRTTVFNSYASELGLNVDQLTKDVASKNVGQKISFDLALGKSIDVSATPTFFLDGKKIDETTSNGLVQGDLTAIRAQLDALVAKNK